MLHYLAHVDFSSIIKNRSNIHLTSKTKIMNSVLLSLLYSVLKSKVHAAKFCYDAKNYTIRCLISSSHTYRIYSKDDNK